MAESGWEIGDKFYPAPEMLRFGDAVLLREVTAMTWAEFSDLMEENPLDPTVQAGLMAAAVWQANPQWRRERVVRFVEALSIDAVKLIGEETVEDALPLDEEPSQPDDDSNSKSNRPAVLGSDITPASTTTDGSPPIIPVSG